MKTCVKVCLLAFGLLSAASLPAYSDDPGPPPPPAEHGANGDQGPAGAPIDGGLGILLAIGAAYGGKKYLQARKEAREELS